MKAMHFFDLNLQTSLLILLENPRSKYAQLIICKLGRNDLNTPNFQDTCSKLNYKVCASSALQLSQNFLIWHFKKKLWNYLKVNIKTETFMLILNTLEKS